MTSLEYSVDNPSTGDPVFVCQRCDYRWKKEIDLPIDWRKELDQMKRETCPRCGSRDH